MQANLLGCAGFAIIANELENELGLLVLDGVVYGVNLAESMGVLGKRTSIYFAYRPPDAKRFTGVFKKFGQTGKSIAAE